MLNRRAKSKGFTLIEVIAAIFLVTVGMGGAYTLIQRTTAFTPVVSARLTATYLAQEGIENIRNIRDTNRLEGEAWNAGISSGDWEVVNINSEPTKFQRRTNITPDGLDILEISVEVKWEERGGTHTVSALTKLYEWR